MAKKKKPSLFWSGVKWAAVVGGGAVLGAYTVRFVDRKFGAPGVDRGDGDAEQRAIAEEAPQSSSPLSNPLAVHAISPIMPIAVQVPPMSPVMMPAMPAMPAMPGLPPLHDEDSYEEHRPRRENPVPPKMTAAERRAKKEADFEELVARFEKNEMF